VTRLHHVNVVVPPGRTDAVVPFYELLGLTRLAKPKEGVAASGAWFALPGGAHQVHVSEREGVRNADQHFALVVDDLDALVTALAEAGHPCVPGKDLLGARRANTADPEGNKVELIEAAGPFTP
jgi:catechol 2,3-dioxygenase-like lactoylglutathione lyase family enzyme